MCIILFSCVNKKADAPDEQYKYAHLPNTITGVLDSIPFYVDTSKVTQDELKGSIAYEDSINFLIETDSLYADSVMNAAYEKFGPEGTQCGVDGSIVFWKFHRHEGRWIDETNHEWLWFALFDNDTICPICNRIIAQENETGRFHPLWNNELDSGERQHPDVWKQWK